MTAPDPGATRQLHFRIPLEDMAYVVSIVEGYEGLAVVTSPGADRGEIVWDVPETRLAEAEALAGVLAKDVLLIRVG